MTAKAAFAAGVGTAFAAGALLWLAAGHVTEEAGPAPPARAPAPGFPAAAGGAPPSAADPGLQGLGYVDSQGRNRRTFFVGPDVPIERIPISDRTGDVTEWTSTPKMTPRSATDGRAAEAERAEKLRALTAAQEELRARVEALSGRATFVPEPIGVARLEGVVLEQDGTPVRGRVVVIAERAVDGDTGSNAAAALRGMTAVVRPDGSFVVRGLDDGQFRLKVWGEDYLQDAPAGPHRPGDRVEIRVVRGAAIVGRVVNLPGDGQGKYLIHAVQDGKRRTMSTLTPKGEFQFRALRPGPVRVEAAPVDAPGHRIYLGDLTAPAMDVEIRWPEPAPADGAPR